MCFHPSPGAVRAALGRTPLGAQSLEHRFRAAHPILSWRLDGDIGYLAVLNEHGITLGAHAKTAAAQVLLQTNGTCELTQPIREHAQFACGTVLTRSCCQNH